MREGDLVRSMSESKKMIGIIVDQDTVFDRWVILWENGTVQNWFWGTFEVINESR
jgi:hypothetical protein